MKIFKTMKSDQVVLKTLKKSIFQWRERERERERERVFSSVLVLYPAVPNLSLLKQTIVSFSFLGAQRMSLKFYFAKNMAAEMSPVCTVFSLL